MQGVGGGEGCLNGFKSIFSLHFLEGFIRNLNIARNKSNKFFHVFRLVAFDHNMSKVSFEHLIGTLKRRLNKAAEKIGDMNKISEKDRLEVRFLTRDGYPNP